jgi:hypothetical protein
MVRHWIWLRNAKRFQVKVQVDILPFPGSITVISNGKTDDWSLSAQGRGLRSWILVPGILFSTWKDNYWIILWLLDFWMESESVGLTPCTFPAQDIRTRTWYSLFKRSKWGAVHVSGSCTTWLVSQSLCSHTKTTQGVRFLNHSPWDHNHP